uniref:AAA family ATPase n=2 Tax=Bacteria TaxID=2 RepID=UPI00265CBC67
MYEAIKAEDTAAVQEVLMNALETVKFGRDNYGCPESSSDVEPPSLYVRAILDMGYLTYREFAFLLWKLEDLGANYTDSLAELKVLRSKGTIDLGEEANKYADCKPIMILVRWGFLAEDTTDSSGGKHIIIAPEVLSKYETRLRNLKIYNIDMDCDEPITNDYLAFEEGETVLIDLDKAARIDNGTNVLLYGVPGSGKSWTIEHEYCKKGTNVERLVFHPDYTYSDFIGQILPNVAEDGQVSYKFTAGPFTNILADAYQNPDKEYILIIEEINRGNAPAIFGE